ncbi:AAA family ATPase [uncultured Aquimarina sp.]|uniref:AAA family ATPase n=1 Tax=uncultured Aquimarina sp. TaxID=575652 RepID=UPI002612B177|nr:AAA family ATPase [uncultured Aquimarina sp.]
MLKKYIITGAPGTGKSTLIDALEHQGIPCLKEMSRKVIINEQNTGNDGMPWENINRFTYLVFEETKAALLNENESVFCDRSLVDNLAYLRHYNKTIPDYLKQFDYTKYYHKTVFIALPWESIYKTDLQRPEGFNVQLALSKQLVETYFKKNFDLVYLPFSTVKERVRFILNELKNKNNSSS